MPWERKLYFSKTCGIKSLLNCAIETRHDFVVETWSHLKQRMYMNPSGHEHGQLACLTAPTAEIQLQMLLAMVFIQRTSTQRANNATKVCMTNCL